MRPKYLNTLLNTLNTGTVEFRIRETFFTDLDHGSVFSVNTDLDPAADPYPIFFSVR
jgi:hypothetical protein